MAHSLPPVPEPKSGAEEFQNLVFYEQMRERELCGMLGPFLDVTDAYASAVSRIVWVAGQVPPRDLQERVVRDLTADTFDFLLAWRRTVLTGKETVAYPLARRAYESLSLLSACLQDPALAARWDGGAEIGNAEIRSRLSKLPFAESEDALRKLYRFFTKGSHPNRDLIGHRFLGEGNAFVLGSIGMPSLVLVSDHCLRLIDMWYWLLGAAAYVVRVDLDRLDPGFKAAYRLIVDQTPEVVAWLTEHHNRLLAEEKNVG